MNQVSIYGLGGAGITNVSGAAPLVDGLANVYYMDTSDATARHLGLKNVIIPPALASEPGKSNMSPALFDTGFLEQEKRGSGKDRSTNNARIAAALPMLFKNAPPSRFNILVCSVTGGSGNMFAYHLAKQLLEHPGLGVMLCLMGNDSDIAQATSCLKVLKTFDNLASQSGRHIGATWVYNDPARTEVETDQIWQKQIYLLAEVFGRPCGRLDSEDRQNFLDHGKFSGHEPALGRIVPKSADFDLVVEGQEVTSAASVITLFPEGGQCVTPVHTTYHATGTTDSLAQHGMVHLLNLYGGFDSVYANCERKLQDQQRSFKAVLPTSKRLGDGTGLVL